jgi:hypothetical protein
LNSSAPTIIGLIRIQKENCPIRAAVNWQSAPAYKIAKLLTKKPQLYFPLQYAFNVKNSTQFLNYFSEIPFDTNLYFVSFDITNMYTNIPTDKLINIVDSLCKKPLVNDKLGHEIFGVSNTILNQK